MPTCYIHSDVEMPIEALQEHHRWPRAYGGPDTPDNVVVLCSSCHDLVHRLSHKLYVGKSGEAKVITGQYLPNQPRRQARLLELASTVAQAKRSHKRSADMPKNGEKVDTVLMSLEVPYWVHHRLKTLSAGKGLYKYTVGVLEKHTTVATRKQGATEEELFAVDDPSPTDSNFLLLKPGS